LNNQIPKAEVVAAGGSGSLGLTGGHLGSESSGGATLLYRERVVSRLCDPADVIPGDVVGYRQ